MVSTSGGPYLSIAAAFIVVAPTFFALTRLGFRFPAVVAFALLAVLRMPRDGLLTRFLEVLLAGFFEVLLARFFDAFLGALFRFVAILTCPLCVQSA
jgi:hypothetical protein